jgi:hypothetical protein
LAAATGGLAAALANKQLNHVVADQKPKPTDQRSNLLESIRLGINLKSVKDRKLEEKKESQPNTVASILSRYVLLMYDEELIIILGVLPLLEAIPSQMMMTMRIGIEAHIVIYAVNIYTFLCIKSNQIVSDKSELSNS